jgi:hypothetical protein
MRPWFETRWPSLQQGLQLSYKLLRYKSKAGSPKDFLSFFIYGDCL